MKAIVVVFLCCISIGTSALAAPTHAKGPAPAPAAGVSLALDGFPDMSCGAWVRSATDSPTRSKYLTWFQGFISGFNYANPQHQITVDKFPSNETTVLYVDKYCRDHPLSIFTGAAFALVKDLGGTVPKN